MPGTNSENGTQLLQEPHFFPTQSTRVIIPETLDAIRTRRLILRPLAVSDAEDIFEHRRLQTVAEWLISPIPDSTVDETREYIRQKTFTTPDGSGAIGRMFSFVILLADDPTGKVIGALGIHSLVPAPVLWYATHPYSWGQGFASEAVDALLDAWWKLPRAEVKEGDEAGNEKLFAGCSVVNAASLKILARNGFRKYRETKVFGRDAVLLEVERPKVDTV
ncbi:GNAT domain-containing protein [Aspergillus carlsbadensis]|nr:GNAT domain-containing protein [Aspergillus carlsbadensis]